MLAFRLFRLAFFVFSMIPLAVSWYDFSTSVRGRILIATTVRKALGQEWFEWIIDKMVPKWQAKAFKYAMRFA